MTTEGTYYLGRSLYLLRNQRKNRQAGMVKQILWDWFWSGAAILWAIALADAWNIVTTGSSLFS